MKIVCISDTHGFLNEISLPEGDVLIHAGDATFQGTIKEIIKLSKDFNALKSRYKKILFIPGNHDFLFEKDINLALGLIGDSSTVLIDQEIVIDSFRFYGAPWQPEFYNWAFNLPRGDKLKRKWDLIPTNTNILITHCPPHGVLDRTLLGSGHVGCMDLKNRVDAVKPALHVFGHIHESYGTINLNGTTFVNASICTLKYKALNKPIIFEI